MNRAKITRCELLFRSAIAILCVLGALVLQAEDVLADKPLRLRVLCYNIHHGEGVDGRLDLDRIAQVIQSVSPDVVAIQEVDNKTQRTGRVDQPAELARLTGMKAVFEKNIEFQGGEYGNAVLSKLPIVRHRNVHLPCFDDGEQRGVLIVELEPEGCDETILFLDTHLDHRSDDRERFASAQRINELIRELPDVPAILAGDLNDTADSRVLEEFAERWSVAGTKELPTVPVSEPDRQIDFILFRPKNRWQVAQVRVLAEAVASDHRAIFAVLELVPREEP